MIVITYACIAKENVYISMPESAWKDGFGYFCDT